MLRFIRPMATMRPIMPPPTMATSNGCLIMVPGILDWIV